MTDLERGAPVEHVWDVETREGRERTPTTVLHFLQHRFVCSCGAASRWRRDVDQARREIERHTLTGQQSWC